MGCSGAVNKFVRSQTIDLRDPVTELSGQIAYRAIAQVEQLPNLRKCSAGYQSLQPGHRHPGIARLW